MTNQPAQHEEQPKVSAAAQTTSGQTTTQFAQQPNPPQQGSRSCAGTLLIVIVTVICTLIVEVIAVVALGGYLLNKLGSYAQKELSNFGITTDGITAQSKTTTGDTKSATTLTTDQKALLTQFGINPNEVPPEAVAKISCVESALGSERIQAIASGAATPGFGDIFKVRGCFNE